MGSTDRHYDIKDILDKAGTGWIADPAKPTLIIEDYQNSWNTCITGYLRFIHIKQEYTKETDKLSFTREHRYWNFTVEIKCQSSVDLQNTFDQMEEVFARYTNTPWSTSTLGTGTTYDKAEVISSTQDPRLNTVLFVMKCDILLSELGVSTVIA